MNTQGTTLGEDDCALNDVLEFAHIAGPIVGGKLVQDGLCHTWCPPIHSSGTLSDEMQRKLRNIFAAVSQGGNMDRKDAEAMEAEEDWNWQGAVSIPKSESRVLLVGRRIGG